VMSSRKMSLSGCRPADVTGRSSRNLDPALGPRFTTSSPAPLGDPSTPHTRLGGGSGRNVGLAEQVGAESRGGVPHAGVGSLVVVLAAHVLIPWRPSRRQRLARRVFQSAPTSYLMHEADMMPTYRSVHTHRECRGQTGAGSRGVQRLGWQRLHRDRARAVRAALWQRPKQWPGRRLQSPKEHSPL
jgi:hypothetical protein